MVLTNTTSPQKPNGDASEIPRSGEGRVGHDNDNTKGHELLCPICSMPDMVIWTCVHACSAGPKVGSPGKSPHSHLLHDNHTR